MATIKERLDLLDEISKRERAIMEAKAHDYAGLGDCNSNIMACERLGIVPGETGILVRLTDKFSRIVTLLQSDKVAVKDESIEDTIMDFRNYLLILLHVIKERKAGKV